MLAGWNGSMTALPLRLKRLISCELAQPPPWAGFNRRVAFIPLLALLLGTLVPTWSVRAEDPIKGEVKAVTDGGYVRLMFQFDEAVEATTRVSGPIIVISFKKPVGRRRRAAERQCCRLHQCCAPRSGWQRDPHRAYAKSETQHDRRG